MNLRERSIIFVTFLIACWALALTAGGLGTKYWVVSSAVRYVVDGELPSGEPNLKELDISSGYLCALLIMWSVKFVLRPQAIFIFIIF